MQTAAFALLNPQGMQAAGPRRRAKRAANRMPAAAQRKTHESKQGYLQASKKDQSRNDGQTYVTADGGTSETIIVHADQSEVDGATGAGAIGSSVRAAMCRTARPL